jgi:hypothetical protein
MVDMKENKISNEMNEYINIAIQKATLDFTEDTKLYKEETKAHMSALLEEFKYRISIIAEQYSTLVTKDDTLEKDIAEAKRQIQIVWLTLGLRESDGTNIKKMLVTKWDEENISKLEKRVTILEQKVNKTS